MLIIAGLFEGFGDSPYSHRAFSIFRSFVYWSSTLVALELSRAYLLSAFRKRYSLLVSVLITMLFTIIMIPWVRLTNPGEPLPFLGGTALPLLSENLLASFLSLIGGPIPAIAYRGILEAFEWWSPILPNLPWIARAFVGTIAPIISLLVVQAFYGESKQTETAVEARKSSSLAGWVIVALISVLIIFFCFGALGFNLSIVGSGSMKPAMDVGDIVIVREIAADDIHEDDVILYKKESSMTIHRIIEIQHDNPSISFVTKGDANSAPDPVPVHPEQIVGEVVFRIPKLGWIGIGIKNLFN
jgi:signal peptidase